MALCPPVFERGLYIAAPAAKVWDALINPEVIKEYFLVPLGRLDPKVGGEIYYGTMEEKIIEGTITEFESSVRLAHTFKFAHRPEDPISTVRYEIESMGKMSKLTVIHDGFPSPNPTYVDISGGWEIILSSLKTLLESGKSLPWPEKD